MVHLRWLPRSPCARRWPFCVVFQQAFGVRHCTWKRETSRRNDKVIFIHAGLQKVRHHLIRVKSAFYPLVGWRGTKRHSVLDKDCKGGTREELEEKEDEDEEGFLSLSPPSYLVMSNLNEIIRSLIASLQCTDLKVQQQLSVTFFTCQLLILVDNSSAIKGLGWETHVRRKIYWCRYYLGMSGFRCYLILIVFQPRWETHFSSFSFPLWWGCCYSG